MVFFFFLNDKILKIAKAFNLNNNFFKTIPPNLILNDKFQINAVEYLHNEEMTPEQFWKSNPINTQFQRIKVSILKNDLYASSQTSAINNKNSNAPSNFEFTPSGKNNNFTNINDNDEKDLFKTTYKSRIPESGRVNKNNFALFLLFSIKIPHT